MKCEGCSDADHCNCSIEVKRENEFNFFILLDTLDGPKWCPSSTIDSMYFNCEPDNFMKILASAMPSETVHGARTSLKSSADQLSSKCWSWQLWWPSMALPWLLSSAIPPARLKLKEKRKKTYQWKQKVAQKGKYKLWKNFKKFQKKPKYWEEAKPKQYFKEYQRQLKLNYS